MMLFSLLIKGMIWIKFVVDWSIKNYSVKIEAFLFKSSRVFKTFLKFLGWLEPEMMRLSIQKDIS